jgi:C-terminal peptidase prc
VLKTIQRDYYNANGAKSPRPDTTKLTYAAIDGMLASLNDAYTTFWNPKEYKASMEDTTGNFVGIGATLDLTKDKKVLIVKPIENSPAMKAGILPGDIIAGVDGKLTAGLDLQKVISRIRGEAGTTVHLTIERKGKPQPFDVAIKRAMVHAPVIDDRMEDETNKIGYIKLSMFNEHADEQFDLALGRLEQQGMKALIFDLRGNPGGLLNIAQDIASRFVDDGPDCLGETEERPDGLARCTPDKHRSPLYKGAYPLIVWWTAVPLRRQRSFPALFRTPGWASCWEPRPSARDWCRPSSRSIPATPPSRSRPSITTPQQA